MREQGMLFVVSGPSGVGKGTLCDILLDRLKIFFCLYLLLQEPQEPVRLMVSTMFL